MAINTPTPEIAVWHEQWTRNRDYVSGEAAVKAKGETYLPKIRAQDSAAEYQAHKTRTGFFPAAFKIAQGWNGLIFSKDPKLQSSERTRLLANLATRDGLTLNELSKWAVHEVLITNFGGILADHPDRASFPDNMSQADELRLGFRPYLNAYTAENILEVTRGFVGLRVMLTRVRLLEDDGKMVRELTINSNGVYEVILHKENEGQWYEDMRFIPTNNGAPLTEIPFTLLNTDNSVKPTPSLMENVVGLNHQHYILEGALAAAINLTAAPIAVTTGYVPEQDSNGNDIHIDFPIEPGAHWKFKSTEASTEWQIYEPKGQELVINKMRDLKDALSAVGHSILAPEKPAPEAAEAAVIRRNAENAMLTSFSKRVSTRLERAYQMWGAWIDGQELSYSLNDDLVAQIIPAQTATMLAQMQLNGQLSLRTLHETLKEGEIMPLNFDPELESQRIDDEQIDLPPTDTGF
ncbi:DUF4055 domain-containing protein [Erythrobacteraceae bacterium WH01K]|nr:DUF4055 domain-containing protein [Erythrobacteraceae bacterium WH01K]